MPVTKYTLVRLMNTESPVRSETKVRGSWSAYYFNGGPIIQWRLKRATLGSSIFGASKKVMHFTKIQEV